MKKNVKFLLLLVIAAIFVIAMQNRHKTQPAHQNPSHSPVSSSLTSDEKFLLDPPSKNASRSALEKHAEMVAKLAQDSDSLEIQNCRPKPLVLKVKQGNDITIKNDDGRQDMIIVDSQHYYNIPSRGSKTIKAEFKYGTGDYGYVCSGSGIVGFIHVVSS